MTILVTGAAGFLGSHVTTLLATSGARPRAFIRPSEDGRPLDRAGADVCTGDIGDRSAVAAALTGVEGVIHCAARTGPWGPASEYERTNVRDLESLVRAAMAAGVRRFVHVSSITVHGNNVRGEADEDAPLRTEPNPYSRTKVTGERVLQRMISNEGAPVTIVRPGWIYGPRDTSSFARIAGKISQRRMIMVGSGQNVLPLIHVRDVAEGLVLACASGRAAGRAYLLVNDQPVTQCQFLAAIAAELDVPAPTRRIPYRAAMMLGGTAEHIGHLARLRLAPPVMRYGVQLLGGDNRFSIARARRELGFSPRIGLAEGIADSIEWYRHSFKVPGRMEVPA
ncbi:MAG TPA: NAD-dependent epimerase/dehydratase family protein [Streptosporangiaceae bacterium]|nr:NAD-dependent epimerase/dehydratase family protein [Streptosporangiaceae bacterium]